jgi:V/A-type H+-transporting ATPase subunit I
MIVKMKKITLMIREAESEFALKKLGDAGVLHIQTKPQQQSGAISQLESALAETNTVISLLEQMKDNRTTPQPQPAPTAEQVLQLNQERLQKQTYLAELQKQLEWYETWGNISNDTLEKLKNSGIHVRFYIAPTQAFENEPPAQPYSVVSKNKQLTLFAVFFTNDSEKLPWTETTPPEKDAETLKLAISGCKKEISHLTTKLEQYAAALPHFRKQARQINVQLTFQRAKANMGNAEVVSYLQGFCPAEDTAQIQQLAKQNGWAYVIADPDEEDDVPTLIKLPKWLKIINPVFQFMGTLPGYREFDVSFWFLLFFSVFFAMLIGDAGYGVIFILATYWIRKKQPTAPAEPFVLMYVLSATTIVWGALTGTWFGYEPFSHLPILDQFVIQRINSYIEENQIFMMYLSFLIGVIQLTIAHLTVALSRLNSPTALAQFGWISVIWALFFLANNLVLGQPAPDFMMALLAFGAALILIFSNFQRNIVKGIFSTLTNLPLDLISAFSDVVSYIRLFAVGMATVIVAQSFNNMAISIGAGSVVGHFFAVMILLIGHGLNIVLGLMAVVVHGIRLNMLEFSGHLGMQWSGKPYTPFKITEEQTKTY